MSLLIRERAGDSLTGVVDGFNVNYLVSLDYNPDRVAVYRNGLLLDPSRDNGYALAAPRGVVMKEPPLDGDTLEVEYQIAATVRTGGGAEGGIPDAPQLTILDPTTYVDGENTPELQVGGLGPATSSQDLGPEISSEDLRPVISPIDDEGGGCP